MKAKPSPNWISLAQAVHCLTSGSAPTFDNIQPHREYRFEDEDPRFEELLEAFLSGDLRSRGRFGRVEIDRPCLEGDEGPEVFKQLRMELRRDASFVLRRGAEKKVSDVPAESWWLDGPVWERSILWVHNPTDYPDERVGAIKLYAYSDGPIVRPYDTEQLICFTNVEVNVEDFLAWQGPALAGVSADGKPRNERNAGRKPQTDWPPIVEWIEGRLQEKLRENAKWNNWHDLWMDIPEDLRGPDNEPLETEPSEKLRKHLSKHHPELYKRIREALKSVKS